MEVYHQTGHNYRWNIDSFEESVGDGLIFSPVNIDADELLSGVDKKIKEVSILDPQLYFLNKKRGHIESYPYFPGNIKSDFGTEDADVYNYKIAELCINYQLSNKFKCIIIPARFYNENPSNYFQQCENTFVAPFCEYIKKLRSRKKILLTVLIKNIMIIDEEKRDEVLNWITSLPDIDGVYLIFDKDFPSKQIKDFNYLLKALNFIWILKRNELEVHIGYNNTEGFLYSIAMPDSITIGSYENLRSFDIHRFQTKQEEDKHSPNARIYSGKLLQWIEYGLVQAIRNNIPNSETYFEKSPYNPIYIVPEVDWHFKQREPYKHYFYVFYNQIKKLPDNQVDRINFVEMHIKNAKKSFDKIEERVLLDGNSDGSHLPHWYNALQGFRGELDK